MSESALLRFIVVFPVAFGVFPVLGFDELSDSGPPGKVRSSTNPDSRVLGNIDSYVGLGKVLARGSDCLCLGGNGGDWFDLVGFEAMLWDASGVL